MLGYLHTKKTAYLLRLRCRVVRDGEWANVVVYAELWELIQRVPVFMNCIMLTFLVLSFFSGAGASPGLVEMIDDLLSSNHSNSTTD